LLAFFLAALTRPLSCSVLRSVLLFSILTSNIELSCTTFFHLMLDEPTLQAPSNSSR
jgi:hypothetical protein